MITVDNLKKVLEELHYTKKKPKEIYEKKYDEYDCVILMYIMRSCSIRMLLFLKK